MRQFAISALGSGLALVLAPVLLGGLGGCSKKESGTEEAPAKIEGIPEAEVIRARQACDAYVERVCLCAASHADMADACQMAKASPTALQINLELLDSVGLEVFEQKAVKVEARKIAAACFANESKLDATKCPRP